MRTYLERVIKNPRYAYKALSRESLLHLYAIAGDVSGVKRLLENGVNIEATNKYGYTVLHRAARSGRIEVVRLLLDQNANIEAVSSAKETPLHQAVNEGHIQVVQLLLKRGADIEAKDQLKQTALHYAVRTGHIEVVRLLLIQNANTEAKDRFKSTSLHQVVSEGYIQMMQVLLEYGADINAQNESKQTVLHQAVKADHIEMVRLLLAQNANTEVKDRCGNAPLHKAASEGRIEILRLLLVHGADIESLGFLENTPVYMALLNNHANIVKILFNKGASLNRFDHDECFLVKKITQQCPVFAMYYLTQQPVHRNLKHGDISELLDQAIVRYTGLQSLDEKERARLKTKSTCFIYDAVLRTHLVKLFFPESVHSHSPLTFQALSAPEKIVVDYCIHAKRNQLLMPFLTIKMIYREVCYKKVGLPHELIYMVEQLVYSNASLFAEMLFYPFYEPRDLELARRQLLQFVYHFSKEKCDALWEVVDAIEAKCNQVVMQFNAQTESVSPSV